MTTINIGTINIKNVASPKKGGIPTFKEFVEGEQMTAE
jgi:hypothetical protein